MPQAGKNDPIGELEGKLAERKIDSVRERFRVPACPQLSPSAGFLACAAGAFLLAADHPSASFLVGISGTLLLALCTCGFSPLDWLGPKERRSVLVVPGAPSEEHRKALVIAVPVFCRLTSSAHYSRKAAFRRASDAFGILLSLALPVLSGAAALRYLPSLATEGAIAGSAFSLLAAAEWARKGPAARARNLAADWVGPSLLSRNPEARPFLLIYSGDEAEVKFFFAKYRRPVFRGQAVFAEFPEGACGPPAASAREGLLFPYRVDPALLARVRAAGEACGFRISSTPTLRNLSGGRIAMSRGFRAVTVFRGEKPSPSGEELSDERAAAWLAEIAAGGT
jgi:hypothetical protein